MLVRLAVQGSMHCSVCSRPRIDLEFYLVGPSAIPFRVGRIHRWSAVHERQCLQSPSDKSSASVSIATAKTNDWRGHLIIENLMAAKQLLVFDFDNTLVPGNTDTWVMDVRPELKLRKRLRELRADFVCWTDLMARVFELLHGAGCGQDEMMEFMRHLEIFPPVAEALKTLRARNDDSTEAIIISDSNTVFIDCILDHCGVRDTFKAVFSNPARFDSEQRLRINHCHSHSCTTCAHSPNMCKGKILREYLSSTASHGTYSPVTYIGDGRGDFCPSLLLTETDTVIVRKGYPLEELLCANETSTNTHDRGSTNINPRACVLAMDFEETLGRHLTARI